MGKFLILLLLITQSYLSAEPKTFPALVVVNDDGSTFVCWDEQTFLVKEWECMIPYSSSLYQFLNDYQYIDPK